ncbi:MAG TPA: hypothetical protein DIC51_06755 [Coxiellaceae bacterium]|nr:hypothetical protein [Coxiellaceae bacterium]
MLCIHTISTFRICAKYRTFKIDDTRIEGEADKENAKQTSEMENIVYSLCLIRYKQITTIINKGNQL